MDIVDCHVHLWTNSQPSPAHRQVREFTAEECIREMDEAGVSACVINPPAWDRTSNEVGVDAARRFPDRYKVLGWFDLDKEDIDKVVADWGKRPGMLGFRITFAEPHQQSWPTDGTLERLCAAAERARLPVSLAAAGFLPVVGQLAERHPSLRLIVDHLGMPIRKMDEAAYTNLEALVALAKHSNVAVKASGAPGASTEAYPYRNMHRYLRTTFDAFGPQRMFWGTDVTRMPCTWRQCVTLFTEELPWLKGRDLELVMGGALRDWIGWKR